MISRRRRSDARPRANRPLTNAPSLPRLYQRFHCQVEVPHTNVRFSCVGQLGGQRVARGWKEAVDAMAKLGQAVEQLASPRL